MMLAKVITKKEPEPTKQELFDLLTKREKEVITLYAEGFTCKQIGDELGISTRTVDTYTKNARLKLKCSNMRQLLIKLGKGN